VAEARLTEDSTDKPADTQPTTSDHRGQYVLISVESGDGSVWQPLFPIVRTKAGSFLGLGDAEASLPESIQRRLPRFLPLTKPTETRRELARVFLEMVGQPSSCIRVTRAKRQ
jgi:hypothetical protein